VVYRQTLTSSLSWSVLPGVVSAVPLPKCMSRVSQTVARQVGSCVSHTQTSRCATSAYLFMCCAMQVSFSRRATGNPFGMTPPARPRL
jgi:hypothetical protein